MPTLYPDARQLDLVEDIHGHAVADPYRWLEDAARPESELWAAAQGQLAGAWLAQLAGRESVRSRLQQLLPGFVGPPYVVGSRRFFQRRLPGQEHPVLLVERGGEERVLIDPSLLAADHTVTLDGWAPSKDGRLLAYQLSQGGDEESELQVMDVDSGALVDGPVDRVRYSPVAWLPGGGELFYVRRLAADEVPAGEEQFHRRVYRHRVGADPSEDVEVFGASCDKTSYFGLETSFDGRWLAVAVNVGTAPRNDLYLADLTAPLAADGLEWRTIVEGVDAQVGLEFGRDGRMYLLTDLGAPRRRLAVADPEHPGPEAWTDLLAENPEGSVLQGVALAGDAIVVTRSQHAVSTVAVHDRDGGGLRYQVELPGLGTAGVASRPDEGPEVWIGYSDHVTPYRVLHLDVGTGEVTDWAEAPGWQPPARPITVRQVVYPSADGTEVRMFVVAGPQEDEPRPTILYGYGGFNIALTPGYSSSIVAWVEAGGVWAVANLRGGSEEGEDWHRDGMRERKQHTFDDLHAAAGWLVDHGLTTPDQLAIMGGSNGGLLVGVGLTQRPDLYAAVVCSAPLLDMVRYEQFGLGRTWNDEYGSAADPAELEWLLGYSPYHHVVPGTRYPAVLFTVFDGDTRVDPLHARKMCAALQAATTAKPEERPVLLRAEANVGHGGRSVSRTVELAADQLSFLAHQLGLALSG